MDAQVEDSFALCGLNPAYTFDRFIIGGRNRMAHASGLAIAETPGKAYNPLYIWGDSGLNKTHLLQAIGNRAVQRHPELKAFYGQSHALDTALNRALEDGTYPSLLAAYAKVDFLLVDNLQDIEGKQATQEHFFRIFSMLREAGKQLVIVSDRPPMTGLSSDTGLRAFCESGLITEMHLPDYEMRVAILRAKAETQTYNVPTEVIEYLAHEISGTVRDLEAALMQAIRHAEQQRQALSLDIAAAALRPVTDQQAGTQFATSLTPSNSKPARSKTFSGLWLTFWGPIGFGLRRSFDMAWSMQGNANPLPPLAFVR